LNTAHLSERAHVEPVLADGTAPFAAGLARLLNGKLVGDSLRLGGSPALPGDFSPPLGR
jgi:hypothetical protein